MVTVGARRGLFQLGLGEIWKYRDLLYFLIWREIKVRYKQTAIGAAWAIVQPLTAMVIFTVVFGRIANIPSDGLPYSLFAYSGLLPWTYFSEAVIRGSSSVVGDGNLIRKVYFPRLIIPLAATATPIVDFALSLLFFLGLLVWYGITPTIRFLYLPVFLFIAYFTALGLGLWLSALNVRYRDIKYAVPFLVQVWMYASPVVFPMSLVPENWRVLFAINPMVGVIEGFRWALLGKQMPDLEMMAVSFAAVIVLLFSGLVFFRRMERVFADIV